jgi:hypothetical protein
MPLHVGDTGATLRITVYEDGTPKNISSASPKQIKIRKPNGTVITKTASFTTNGADGKLEVATDSDDLDIAGRYSMSAYMTIGSWTGYTAPVRFDVEVAP